MKNKTLVMRIVLIVFALVVGTVANLHIAAKKEVQSITGAMAHADKMEVSLHNSVSGESLTVTDPAELEKISAALSDIQYKGPYKSRDLIQPSDHACSIVVSVSGSHETMTLYPSDNDQPSYITSEPPEPGLVAGAYAVITLYPADHDQSSYITGEPLDTALKNTDALYETIWSFFE